MSDLRREIRALLFAFTCSIGCLSDAMVSTPFALSVHTMPQSVTGKKAGTVDEVCRGSANAPNRDVGYKERNLKYRDTFAPLRYFE